MCHGSSASDLGGLTSMENFDQNDLDAVAEKKAVKEALNAQQDGEVSLKKHILDKDSYKQPIVDNLLGINRRRIPRERDDGTIFLQEYVRLEDPRGRWVSVAELSDEQWKDLISDGHINQEGAEFVLSYLNSLSNNNTSFSNLKGDDIKEMLKQAEVYLTNILTERMDRYEIDDLQTVDYIVRIVTRPNVMASLMQSKDGGVVKEIFRNTNVVADLNEGEEGENLSDKLNALTG